MSKTNTFIARIRDLIAKDEVKTAIQELSALLKDCPQLDEAVQQSARYNHIMQQIRLGLVDFQSANIAQNQIRHGILELLREIEEQGVASAAIRSEVEQYEKGVTIIQNAEKIYNIVNSKNSKIDDRDTHNLKNNPFSMKNILYFLATIIALLAIWYLFQWYKAEPDNREPLPALLSAMSSIVLLIIAWRIEGNTDSNNQSSNGNANRHIEQHGDKSVYVEENKGDINIH